MWKLVGDRPGPFWFGRILAYQRIEGEAREHLMNKASRGR